MGYPERLEDFSFEVPRRNATRACLEIAVLFRLIDDRTESDGRGQAVSGLHSAGFPSRLGAGRCGACPVRRMHRLLPLPRHRRGREAR